MKQEFKYSTYVRSGMAGPKFWVGQNV